MLFTQCTVLLRVYIKIVRYDGRVLTTTKLYITTTQDVSSSIIYLKHGAAFHIQVEFIFCKNYVNLN